MKITTQNMTTHNKETMDTSIDFEDFLKVQMHVGTVLSAELNAKALKPAYIVTIDFGELGIKTSSAQITEHYLTEHLIGTQIIAVMNFPSKRIAGIKSEVLILATVSKESGTKLLRPDSQVENGTRVL